MASLTRAEIIGGRRIDGTVIHVAGSTIRIREGDGREIDISWPKASEDVQVNHQISAFVTPDGLGHYLRNLNSGHIVTTHQPSLDERGSWTAIAAIGGRWWWLSLVPVVNYFAALLLAVPCFAEDRRAVLTAGFIWAVLTLPLLLVFNSWNAPAMMFAAWTPTISIAYAMRAMVLKKLREHNAAIWHINGVMTEKSGTEVPLACCDSPQCPPFP